MNQIKYEPDEKCPPSLAILSALQIFLPNTISVVMLATLVVRSADQPEEYLAWVVFTALAMCGLGTILHSLSHRYVGSGRVVVTNFNVPFLAVSALALHTGGPGLLASLIVASTLVQIVLTLRLAYLRRIFTQTVSGTIVMLVAVSAVPFIVSRAVIPPEDMRVLLFLSPGIVALGVGIIISLRGSARWRLWTLPATVLSGVIVAVPLGLYDVGSVIAAPWVSVPVEVWPGLDLSFSADFWALLPAFVIVNLTAFLKVVGDLSVIYSASYRQSVVPDFRTVQAGLKVYGAGTMFSGLLGTLPVAAPWAATVVYVGFTGIASKAVGLYLGLFTVAIAPFSKLVALLVAIPSPVVSAVYVIVFGMLFIEGAKTAFAGQVNQKRAAIIGVSMVLGLSAGSFGGLVDGFTPWLSSTIVVGGLTAIGMTAFTELSNLRNMKLRAELARSALPDVDDFLCRYADRHNWPEDSRNRLRLVGEEVLLHLLEEDDTGASGENGDTKNRRLVANIHPDGGSAEIEFIVDSGNGTGENLEDRLIYLGDDFDLGENAENVSVRILRHYISSVHHRKYQGIDIITCRVDK